MTKGGIRWKKDDHCAMCFPNGSASKESTCDARDQETWVRSPGQEDPLEKEMAAYSSVLA